MAKEKKLRVNEEIGASTLRLIGPEGEQVGVVSRSQALDAARDAGLDLVEISPTAEPPVCRIMDFGKFLYMESKKQQAARRNQKQTQVKEVKFRPQTDDGDYQVKLRNLLRFFEEGDRAKITLRFRGREMAHQELGRDLLKRLEEDLKGVAVVEQYPRMEGRQMVMVMSPRKR
ncbi:MAG TPA: translation initiation factor IF-3 [Gammaproteobacteria bacterium]|uniref:translation initiation factor IF-3 n=1 Tax=Immundisolibacter sp. TaxID=1934948 RepID=UPI000E872304|nr:translation initiation factor IF-3 [Gammaproteobacteria bacterium]MCH79170.1 translation initiation factor IF-3 [Gammaproteobacteria bacterium]